MSVADYFMGPTPRYNPALDPLARPLAAEIAEAPVHAAQCAFRYGQLKGDVVELRREMRNQRVFNLLLVAGVAGGVKLLDFVSSLAKVM